MTTPLTAWWSRLDRVGMNDPDNNEGHPEDICTVCDRRVVDHPSHEVAGIGNGSALWAHRRAVLAGLIIGRL